MPTHSDDNDYNIFQEKIDKLKMWWEEDAKPWLKNSQAGKLLAKKEGELTIVSEEESVEVKEETQKQRELRIAEQYRAKSEDKNAVEEVAEKKKIRFSFLNSKNWNNFFKSDETLSEESVTENNDATQTITLENHVPVTDAVAVDESVEQDLSKKEVKELLTEETPVEVTEVVVEQPKPIIPYRVILNNRNIIMDENTSSDAVISAFTVIHSHLDIEKDGKYSNDFTPVLEAATVRAAKLGHDKALAYLGELPNRDAIAPAIWIDAIQSNNIKDGEKDPAVIAFEVYSDYVSKKENSKVTGKYIDVVVPQINSKNANIRNGVFNETTTLLKNKQLNATQTKKVMGMLKDTLASESNALKKEAAKVIVETMQAGDLNKRFEATYTTEIDEVITKIKGRRLLEKLSGANKSLFNSSLRQLAYNSISGDNSKVADTTFPQALDMMEMYVVKDNKPFIKGNTLEAIIRGQPDVEAFLNKNELMKFRLQDKDKKIADLFVDNKSDVSDNALNKENAIVAENANDTFVAVEDKKLQGGAKPGSRLEIDTN